MSVASAVITALEEYEFDPEAGFARLDPGESHCLGYMLHRSSRLVCVVDEKKTAVLDVDITIRNPAGGEQHDDDEIKYNITRLTLGSAAKLSFTLRRSISVPFAFRDPLDNETSSNKANWPERLPAEFLALIQRCGNPTPRIVVRFAGQGVSQATPQRRRQLMEEGDSSEQGGMQSTGLRKAL
ncbi:hypothetical protein FBEOM_13104 [Fusarium beomiforme]|uniref:Uncharacterized protein n=1 Tax=Fusarium beomiforme TaxID=44412 RepID=A0A9P5DRW2_9HYPO|nr:hypothetical protein FBEOM_13104 [Fusarium beomiforme]